MRHLNSVGTAILRKTIIPIIHEWDSVPLREKTDPSKDAGVRGEMIALSAFSLGGAVCGAPRIFFQNEISLRMLFATGVVSVDDRLTSVLLLTKTTKPTRRKGDRIIASRRTSAFLRKIVRDALRNTSSCSNRYADDEGEKIIEKIFLRIFFRLKP